MNDKIDCPNCGHSFDVEEALAGKLEASLRKEFEEKAALQAEKLNAQRQNLIEQEKQLHAEKEAQNERLKEQLNLALKAEREKIEKQNKEEIQQELDALREENLKRKNENTALRKKEVEMMQKEQALKEKAEELELEVQKKMLEQQKSIEEKAALKEREKFEMERLSLQKQIDDNKKLAEEMKRKAEQGSMQLQGEVQELALEDLLTRSYPFDRIEEVSKGIRGADCLQFVVNELQQECGSIVYESKRTQNFSGDWIEKLKNDQVACKADIAVIVTQTMPKDMEHFGLKDGVWICSFREVASVSLALREMLLRLHRMKSSEENKGDKMLLLYNYLTSNEFVQNVQIISENYNGMLEQLNTEKRAMMKMWKVREKQIWAVQENIGSLFGSIKGIAGNALPNNTFLELDSGEEDAS